MRRMITAFATAAAIAFSAMPAQATNLSSDAQHDVRVASRGVWILLHERRDLGTDQFYVRSPGHSRRARRNAVHGHLQLYHQRHGYRQWFGHDGGFVTWPRRSD